MINIIDYGMGNLRSVQKAFNRLGHEARFITQPEEIRMCDRLVLPGVGAFAQAIEQLRCSHMDDALCEYAASGRPLLGICLGMQMLFQTSYENGIYPGLGILSGEVVRFSFQENEDAARLPIPHMGWNQAYITQPGHPFWKDIKQNDFFYFVHSYYVKPCCSGDISATTEYGFNFCSAVCHDNIMATQFHPEKSQISGLKLLDNFTRF